MQESDGEQMLGAGTALGYSFVGVILVDEH